MNTKVSNLGRKIFEVIMANEPDVAKAEPEAVADVTLALAVSFAGVLSGVILKQGQTEAEAVAKLFAKEVDESVSNIVGKVVKLLDENYTVN
jgi:hypothetical protein